MYQIFIISENWIEVLRFMLHNAHSFAKSRRNDIPAMRMFNNAIRSCGYDVEKTWIWDVSTSAEEDSIILLKFLRMAKLY